MRPISVRGALNVKLCHFVIKFTNVVKFEARLIGNDEYLALAVNFDSHR